jgi:hypothetical protein
MRWMEIIERPIMSYIIMGIFSSIAAVIFFLIGGSVAAVTAEDNVLVKAGFEATGTIAGFVIIFLLSFRVLAKLKQASPTEKKLLREYVLRSESNGFDPRDTSLTCAYKLYDTESGGWSPQWKEISHVRAAGGLKIFVSEMGPSHLIRVKLEDGRNHVWEPEEDLAYGVSPIYLKRTNGA